MNVGIQIGRALCVAVVVWSAHAQDRPVVPPASQTFMDDIVLLPVECLLVEPLSGKGGQDCLRKDKPVQLQTTKPQYALLDSYNVNSPYDVISKKCTNLSKHYRMGTRFWCHNRQENWSIEFSYYFQSHPAINVLYLQEVELKTCASANVQESFGAVVRKFGQPSQVQSDDERLVFTRLDDRLTVSHRQSIPGELRYQTNDFGNSTFSCPGNFYLLFKLQPRQFQSGRANVIAKIQADQSKGSSPKF